jgi:NAD(P)-dependent dehydrogenase (short-subunit alcohol dehydrogenase family)
MRFEGHVVLVTGGGSGIGQAIARRFGAEGASVAVADMLGDRAESTARAIQEEGGIARALTLDVTLEAEVIEACAGIGRDLGPVTILVNNAGRSIGADVTKMTADEWDANFDVVIKSAFLCSRAVLPGMIERGGGVILNVSSVNGMFGIGEEGYSAAKAGLLNLTRNLAVRYGKYGIRANAISPGTIRTPIWSERVARDPHVFDSLNRWYPLGRVGEVDDVAAAALFLCSDEASWVTGVNLPVDGGLTAGSYRMMEDLGGG